MEIKPIKRVFQILLSVAVVKYTNPLSKEARRDFLYMWDKFYMIEISWGYWKKEFSL